MVSDELMTAGERGLCQQRTESVGDERAVDEHNRLARTDHLGLQRDPAEDSVLQLSLLCRVHRGVCQPWQNDTGYLEVRILKTCANNETAFRCPSVGELEWPETGGPGILE